MIHWKEAGGLKRSKQFQPELEGGFQTDSNMIIDELLQTKQEGLRRWEELEIEQCLGFIYKLNFDELKLG